MLIKKIIIKNFRQYSDENEIEFSVDPEKNITFILGFIYGIAYVLLI